MNLLAKSLGQLAVLAVALFFFSCEDPTSIGIPNPTSKSDIAYVDIPLKSSVVILDSIRTSNFTFQGDFNRFLAGQYADPEFGNTTAAFFTQFFTTSTAKLPATATLDTAFLELGLDLYTYGPTMASSQTFSVHQISESLGSALKLTNETQIDYDATPIATQSYLVDPVEYKKYLDNNKDTLLSIIFPLDQTFGQSLFQSALDYRDGSTAEDSTFVRFTKFIEVFKGIAVVPNNADKIVRFNPATCRIVLRYHTDTEDSLDLNFSFTGVTGFNQILNDRFKDEVTYQDLFQDEGKRYIQSGTGVFTKIDLQPFYEFADSIPNAIINSAEFVINDIDATYTPPSTLGFRLLQENNREKIFSTTNEQHLKDLQKYQNYLKVDLFASTQPVVVQPDSVFYTVNDVDSPGMMSYSSDDKKYSGFATFFVQQLFTKDDRSRLRYFLLYPLSPKYSKSVNRTVFPTDKIKLRIHYTRPINLNQ